MLILVSHFCDGLGRFWLGIFNFFWDGFRWVLLVPLKSDDMIVIFFQSDSIFYFLSSLIKIKSFLNDIKIYCFPLLHQNRSIKLWNQTLKRKWIPPPLKITQICYSRGGLTLLKYALNQSIWHDGAHTYTSQGWIQNKQWANSWGLAWHQGDLCLIPWIWAKYFYNNLKL